MLLFTSGTSAAPKAAVLEHDQLLAYVFNTLEFASRRRGRGGDRVVPPFHVAGVAAVLSSTYIGRRIVPVPGVRFSAEEWIVTARDEQVTHAMLVPTMLGQDRRGDGGRPERCACPSLRASSYGGARMHGTGPRAGAAPVPRDRLRQRLRAHRDEQHRRASSAPTTTASRSTATSRCSRRASSSVGQPLPGIEIRIVGETGDDLGADEPGEIQIRGDQVSGKYVGTESKTDADGWLHTGDRGWLDVEGYLFCEGRADDTIIRGGENIGPAEIEDALLQHDAISVAAVVGLADEE